MDDQRDHAEETADDEYRRLIDSGDRSPAVVERIAKLVERRPNLSRS
jgi:hypothetical protein